MPLKPIYERDMQMGRFRWSSELFNRKIDTTPGYNACWPWLGSKGPAGPLFGVRIIQPDGTDLPRMTQARRIAWAEFTGSMLNQRQSIYHACGNKHCMNVQHYTLERPPAQERLPELAYKPKQKPGPKLGSKRTPKAKPGVVN